MRRIAFGLVALLAVTPAAAHPGRLDAEGCHHVLIRFVHQSGKVDKVGTCHCHRALGAMRLDGTEQMQDETSAPRLPERERRPAPR